MNPTRPFCACSALIRRKSREAADPGVQVIGQILALPIPRREYVAKDALSAQLDLKSCQMDRAQAPLGASHPADRLPVRRMGAGRGGLPRRQNQAGVISTCQGASPCAGLSDRFARIFSVSASELRVKDRTGPSARNPV